MENKNKSTIILFILFAFSITACSRGGGTPSSAKAITAFSLSSPAAMGIINEVNHTIVVTVPFKTDVSTLVPTITHKGASINPAPGVAQNFTRPVTYTVTAADNSTQAYTVTVYRRFTDDFNRADSASVGNGWNELDGLDGSAVTLTGNMARLTSGSNGGASTMVYNAVFSGDCSIVMTVNFASPSSYRLQLVLLPAVANPTTQNYVMLLFGGRAYIYKDYSVMASSDLLSGMTTGRDYLITFTKVSAILTIIAKDKASEAEVSASYTDSAPYNDFTGISLRNNMVNSETVTIDDFTIQSP